MSVADIGTTLETLLGGRVVTDVQARHQAVRRDRPGAGRRALDAGHDREHLPAGQRRPGAARERGQRAGDGGARRSSTTSTACARPPSPPTSRPASRSGTGARRPRPDRRRRARRRRSGADLAGQSREFRESSSSLYFLFLFAVVFIYLVLAAQFESFIHPLTILLSVPLAVVGALISLFVLRQSLNIYSQIGLDHADRAGDQERDPDRRVREPAPGARRGRCSTRWWRRRGSGSARSS